MRFLFVCFLFVLFPPAKSQEATHPSMLIDINEALNFYDFEQMRSFILKNGDRQTYCPNYTDNPHYVMKSENLEIYMNPTTVGELKPKDLDYKVMYIISRDNKLPFNYYVYLTDRRDVFLYDYNRSLSDESVRRQVLIALNSILQAMKKEMKLVN